MGDENPIRTLGDYSKHSHEGYRNTIDLPTGNNLVPLRSDTIRLVQNGCSFHGLRYEDPNQHLKDFLKLVESLDLDVGTTSRDFAKAVKEIALAHKCPEYIRPPSNRARKSSPMLDGSSSCSDTQVNKITTSCEICSGPHDTQYYMEDPEQAFVEYASSRTNEAGAKQDDQQNRIAGALPSDTIKNPKLSTTLVLSARSYPTIDPQCSSHPSTSINAIKTHFKEATISQTSLWRPEIEIEPQQPEEPEPTLKDEFQDLHLNLPVLKVLDHAPIYDAILDKYVKSLELGKNRSAFVQGEVPAKMEDLRLFTLPCRLGDSKPFDTLADLGSCLNIIPLYLFKKLNIRLLEKTDDSRKLTP
ncbi:hypothetical protein Tco_0508222 [Tanacetum coccineum]